MTDNSGESTGVYERAVQWVTERVKPSLHKVTERFVKKSVNKYAKDDERYARMIEFEVKRRGDGAGLTQDVAEPLVWVGIKSGLAVAIETVMRPFKSKENFQWKWIGHATALGIIAQQAVELFRVLPRYKAGLQGSLEMAKDRWKALQETGVDPFSSQTREISRKEDIPTVEKENTEPQEGSTFSRNTPKNTITPDAILESKTSHQEISKT